MSLRYKGYLDVCMPSEVMRDYLKGIELESWQIVDLVIYSPIPIEKKLAELRRIKAEADSLGDHKFIQSLNNSIRNIECAMKHLESDGVFSIETVEYDKEAWHGTDSDFRTICSSFQGVRKYIKDDLESSEIEPDELHYYEVCKWEKDDSGEYVNVCTYVIPRDEIIYSKIEDDCKEIDSMHVDNCYFAANLNVPVPFKPGDILEFNGFPFGPKNHALILDIGDNWDCCCVQGLARNDEGRWCVGAVKHGSLGPDYFLKYSYLYNARYDSNLFEGEEFLYKVRDFIRGDEKRARTLYEKFWYRGFTEDEMTEILRKLENADD